MASAPWAIILLGADGDAAGSSTALLYGVIGAMIGIILGLFAGWQAAKGRAAPVAPPKPAEPPKPSGEPLRLLALLQRDGRLLDFLMEDIQAYGDAQVGAGVRQIHADCRKVLQDHLALEPVLKEPEGSSVTVPVGFDPSAIRLTGNVTGQPPFTGALRHPGWRVRELRLTPPPAGQDPFVVQPAVVELA
jgi:hypothetical protein